MQCCSLGDELTEGLGSIEADKLNGAAGVRGAISEGIGDISLHRKAATGLETDGATGQIRLIYSCKRFKELKTGIGLEIDRNGTGIQQG